MKPKKKQPVIGVPAVPMRRPATLAHAAEPSPISAETLQVIRLPEIHTQGRFDLWRLAGRSNAERRAALGGTRTPQAKAGVDALRAAFYEVLGIVGDYEAEREENFRFVCGEVAATERDRSATLKTKTAVTPQFDTPDVCDEWDVHHGNDGWWRRVEKVRRRQDRHDERRRDAARSADSA